MKFPYLVKHNGVYYPIGTDVPIEDENGGGMNTPAVDTSGEADVVEEPTIEVKDDVEEIKEDVAPKGHKYSEDDLNVPIFQLRALAKDAGLKVTNKAKAEDIKEMLRAI